MKEIEKRLRLLAEKNASALDDCETDLSSYPTELQLEILLHRKTIGKSVSQRTSMRKYYRDLFEKTGLIPDGLFHREGRKASGRKRVISPKVEKRFIEMVRGSADDNVNAPDFITKNLRTVVNFHRRLKDEFDNEKILLDALYRLVKRHGLKKYLDKPDYDAARLNKKQYFFQSQSVFTLIQMDGCRFHYFQIKNEIDEWANPCGIEIYDTGSRYMFAMDVYFSESNKSSVDIFSKFLRSTAFPQKTINFRPDNSKGFVNLKRPVRELNHKYSLYPGGFFLNDDFARPRKAKDKPHLESSHRRLHGFEDFIIAKLPHERLVERVRAMKIKSGKFEIITVSRFDINLEEFRATGLIQRYLEENNERFRTFGLGSNFAH